MIIYLLTSIPLELEVLGGWRVPLNYVNSHGRTESIRIVGIIIVHRLPENHQHSTTDVWEGTELGAMVTFHGDELTVLGDTFSPCSSRPPLCARWGTLSQGRTTRPSWPWTRASWLCCPSSSHTPAPPSRRRQPGR